MKAKLLSFVFINFSESGLFKGLRAKKIKNPIPSQLARQVAREEPWTDIHWTPRSGLLLGLATGAGGDAVSPMTPTLLPRPATPPFSGKHHRIASILRIIKAILPTPLSFLDKSCDVSWLHQEPTAESLPTASCLKQRRRRVSKDAPGSANGAAKSWVSRSLEHPHSLLINALFGDDHAPPENPR